MVWFGFGFCFFEKSLTLELLEDNGEQLGKGRRRLPSKEEHHVIIIISLPRRLPACLPVWEGNGSASAFMTVMYCKGTGGTGGESRPVFLPPPPARSDFFSLTSVGLEVTSSPPSPHPRFLI